MLCFNHLKFRNMIKYASYFRSFNDLIEIKNTGFVDQVAENHFYSNINTLDNGCRTL